jgi:hypothetical protein
MTSLSNLRARVEGTDHHTWITLTAERALYIDAGRTIVLCDRLPARPTLLLQLGSEARAALLRALESTEAGG